MKILPVPPPTVRPSAGTAAAAIGDRPSFEDLLQAPERLRQERRERAFGFSELGLLSARGVVRAAANPSPPDVDPRDDEAGNPAGPQKTSDHHDAEWTTSHLAGTHAFGTRESARTSDRALARPRPSFPLSSPAAPTAGELPPAVETDAPIHTRVTSHRQSPPSSKQLKLVVLEQNGSLRLIAGSPELGAEERARLRRAAAAVAAEFGLSIDSFTLNGSYSEPPFTPIGASHGHHRR